MKKDWESILARHYRKCCFFEDALAGEVQFYAFDAAKESEGIERLMDDFMGSEKYLAEQLEKQLGVSLKDVVMFGVCCELDDFNDRPLIEAVEETDQVEGLLFYNPKTGAVYHNSEGTFDKRPRTLDKLGIRRKPKDD